MLILKLKDDKYLTVDSGMEFYITSAVTTNNNSDSRSYIIGIKKDGKDISFIDINEDNINSARKKFASLMLILAEAKSNGIVNWSNLINQNLKEVKYG